MSEIEREILYMLLIMLPFSPNPLLHISKKRGMEEEKQKK